MLAKYMTNIASMQRFSTSGIMNWLSLLNIVLLKLIVQFGWETEYSLNKLINENRKKQSLLKFSTVKGLSWTQQTSLSLRDVDKVIFKSPL